MTRPISVASTTVALRTAVSTLIALTGQLVEAIFSLLELPVQLFLARVGAPVPPKPSLPILNFPARPTRDEDHMVIRRFATTCACPAVNKQGAGLRT